jgi:hypothetical protein
MISKNKKLIILMPPKTASNSIRALLQQFEYVFSTHLKMVLPQIHLRLSEIIDLHDVTDLSEYKIIQITRNPYHRYVSSFFHQNRIIPENYNSNFKNFNLTEFSKHLLDSKKSNNFIESFYGDASFINSSINRGESWGGSRLFDTQVSWDDIGANVEYFKLENLTTDISELKNFLGVNFKKLPLINSWVLNNHMDLITPEIKDIVVELFDEDFTKFNYIK